MSMNVSTHEAIDCFFNEHPVRQYRRGQVLILPGEGADYAYYLVRGRMKVYDISYRGDEITIDVFKEPAIFPLSLILNQSSTRYIYEADSDIEIRRAPASATLKFLSGRSDMVLDLLSHLYDRMDNVIDRMVHLVSCSAKKRIVHELIVTSHQLGERHPGGGYSLEMTEKELGSKIGLSRETVSREMKSLKQRKLIEINHKHIIIGNLASLEAYEQLHH